MSRFENIISAIDSHTEGQSTRIILSGLPLIKGATMAEKFVNLNSSSIHNKLREALMREPRGHRGMFGAIVTDPCHSEAHCGVVFTSTDEFYPMCVHGSIGVSTAMIEMGIIKGEDPETDVVLDTAVGLVHAHVTIEGGRAKTVRIENAPAFLYQSDVELDVPKVGSIKFDIAFGGLFFVLIPGEQLGLKVEPKNIDRLVDFGLRILITANKMIDIKHPVEKHINKINCVEITGPASNTQADSRNIVIIQGGLFDRSPCGTGTCARMAALYSKGELKLHEEYVHESIIGSLFYGSLLRETTVGDYKAVVPAVVGSAYITGLQQFVIDPDDPMKYGFSI